MLLPGVTIGATHSWAPARSSPRMCPTVPSWPATRRAWWAWCGPRSCCERDGQAHHQRRGDRHSPLQVQHVVPPHEPVGGGRGRQASAGSRSVRHPPPRPRPRRESLVRPGGLLRAGEPRAGGDRPDRQRLVVGPIRAGRGNEIGAARLPARAGQPHARLDELHLRAQRQRPGDGEGAGFEDLRRGSRAGAGDLRGRLRQRRRRTSLGRACSDRPTTRTSSSDRWGRHRSTSSAWGTSSASCQMEPPGRSAGSAGTSSTRT